VASPFQLSGFSDSAAYSLWVTTVIVVAVADATAIRNMPHALSLHAKACGFNERSSIGLD
jgi:hypothetical protein